MVSRPGELPAPLPLRARVLRARVRCDLLRSVKMQAITSADPAQNIELIELTGLPLVVIDFLQHLAPAQEGVHHAKEQTDAQPGRAKRIVAFQTHHSRRPANASRVTQRA